ncbi:Fibrinogen [Aphelenchoides avenae]|nr:Fibrinogen [Aphelenchus avenae]
MGPPFRIVTSSEEAEDIVLDRMDLTSPPQRVDTIVRVSPPYRQAAAPNFVPMRLPASEESSVFGIGTKPLTPTKRPIGGGGGRRAPVTRARVAEGTYAVGSDETPSAVPQYAHVGGQKYDYVETAEEAKDCEGHRKNGHRKSGVYRMNLATFGEFYALCLMEDPEHAWTVLQRRTSAKEHFWNRTFEEYAAGFGNAASDDWLGLEKLHAYIRDRKRWLQIRIELRGDFCQGAHCSGLGENGYWWADWDFKISGADDKYRLNVSPVLRGNMSTPHHDNLFSMNNGERFSTVDQLNNGRTQPQCAKHRRWGAWWHRDCTLTALNGEYGGASATARGQFWMYQQSEKGPLHSYYIKPMRSLILFRVNDDLPL